MGRMGGRWILPATVLAALLAGCRPCPTELVSREQLIARYNGNALGVAGLRAVADVQIELADRVAFNKVRLTDGRLYYRQGPQGPLGPPYFLLRGKEVGQVFFELGIDPEAGEFYYWVKPPRGEGFARWGKLDDAHLGGAESVPIDPTQLLNLLGVVPWPTDPEASSQVILKTLDDPCVYAMLVVARVRAWGGWFLQREQWIDRRRSPLRVRRVWLYDRQGLGVMEATLDRYEAVSFDRAPVADAPETPTDIEMRWPDADDIRSIRVRLSGARVIEADNPIPPPTVFDRRRRIPNDILNARPLGAPAGATDPE